MIKKINIIMFYFTYQWDTFRSSLQRPPPPWCPTWSPGLRTGQWCSGRSWWWGWSERPVTPDQCRWSTVTAPAWRPPGSDHSQRSSLGRNCDEPHPYSAGGSGCCGSGRPWPPGPGTDSGTSSITQDTAEALDQQTVKFCLFWAQFFNSVSGHYRLESKYIES